MPLKRLATAASPPAESETEAQRFTRLRLSPQFKPLKDVFDNLGLAAPLMEEAIIATNSYQNFLGKLGYRLVIEKYIHENDCYPRLGPKGGIRAVLPVHDVATYSTFVTLVNFDASVTTTAKAVGYYDAQLAEFKTLLIKRSGNAR